MNYWPSTIFFILISVFCYTSCKDELVCDDPQNLLCPNYDPCAGFVGPNAQISIYTILVGPDCPGIDPFRREIQEDTIVARQVLHFESRSEIGSHQWDIGGIINQTGNLIGNISLNAIESGNIVVQLIEEFDDADMCLDFAARRDTSYRNVYLKVWDGSLEGAPPIVGNFEGTIGDDLETSYVVNIPVPDIGRAISFPMNGCDTLDLGYDISYRDAIFYSGEGACKTICGFAHVSENNSEIVLDYMETDESGNTVSKRFLGARK